tara:strand:- start:4 stop:693 length:690 start_codon:yes stop_codon:yes gene_type:complete
MIQIKEVIVNGNNTGQIRYNKRSFSKFFQPHFRKNFKNLIDNITLYCKRYNYDFKDYMSSTYILGPAYKEGDVQIGFTGNSKFKLIDGELYQEEKNMSVDRELFEESGLLIPYNSIDNNSFYNLYNLQYGHNIKKNLEDNLAKKFIKYKEEGWTDAKNLNLPNKTKKNIIKQHNLKTSTIIICSIEDFDNTYSDSKIFFKKISHLTKDDNIISICCINLYDAYQFIQKN